VYDVSCLFTSLDSFLRPILCGICIFLPLSAEYKDIFYLCSHLPMVLNPTPIPMTIRPSSPLMHFFVNSNPPYERNHSPFLDLWSLGSSKNHALPPHIRNTYSGVINSGSKEQDFPSLSINVLSLSIRAISIIIINHQKCVMRDVISSFFINSRILNNTFKPTID